MKTKKIYIFIAILLVILIAVALFFIIKNKSVSPVVPTTETLEENSTEETKLPQKENNKEEFSNVLKDAREATLAKDYTKALSYYKQALSYGESEIVYGGMYGVYLLQNNLTEAEKALNNAIKIKPSYTEYYIWKIDFLRERMKVSYSELKNVYTEALPKTDSRTRVNLVIHFARISEEMGEKNEAIALWQKAIEIYPSNKEVYEAEITRLSNLSN